jgi:hypothetical protein
MKDIEKSIRQVDAIMSMEGMPLDELQKNRIRKVLSGEAAFDIMKKQIIAEHTPVQEHYGT